MTSPAPSAPPASVWSQWLGRASLVLLLWLSTVHLPSPTSAGLDRSWQMVLNHAADQGWQHGRDIVFTYGPAGYLFATTYTGHGLAQVFVGQAVLGLVMALGFALFARGLRGWRPAAFIAYLLLFGSSYPDALHILFIAVLGVLTLHPDRRGPPWRVLTGGALAFLSLVKFTNFALCAVVLAVQLAAALVQRDRRGALWLAGTFAAALALGWLAFGQSLANLPAFLHYGAEISSGYVAAMGIEEAPAMFWLGFASAGLAGVAILLHLATSADRSRSLPAAVIVAAVVFLNWKHGFVRADSHMLAHFITTLFVAAALPALLGGDDRWTWAKRSVLLLCAAGSLAGIYRVHPPVLTEAVGYWNVRIREVILAAVRPGELIDRLERERRLVADANDLPITRRLAGRESLDVFGNKQAVALTNDFNYRPRPAIQSYTAYTGALARLDEAFYRSPAGPRFVLQDFSSVDHRYAALDDSLAYRLLLQNYDFVLEEGGLLLWERPATLAPAEPADPAPFFETDCALGEEIALPALPAAVWARILVRPNLAGRARQFLYKPAELRLELQDESGARHDYRFFAAAGETGFLLAPHFRSPGDLLAYQDGRVPPAPARLRLRTVPGGEQFYQDRIHIVLTRVAPPKQSAIDANRDLKSRFRMSNRRPVLVEAHAPLRSSFTASHELLQLHAPSTMEFDLAAQPARRLAGAFGLSEAAFTGGNTTDGVEFVVAYRTAAGERTLFRRWLDPLRRAEDRPLQPFSVELPPPEPGARVVLRTLPGPADNLSCDWSYWTDLRFE